MNRISQSEFEVMFSDLGQSLTIVEDGGSLEDAVYQLCVRLSDAIKSNLTEQNAYYSSSQLLQSIAVTPPDSARGIVNVTIEGADYAFFMDSGVDGMKVRHNSEYSFKYKFASKKMVAPISKWITRRGIKLHTTTKTSKASSRTGKLRDVSKARTSLAWAIATAVKRDGIEPTHFISDALQETTLINFSQALANWLGEKIEVRLASNVMN